MIKIIGNDITRGGQKLGYFQGNDIFDAHNKKLGYFRENDIYDGSGRKLGYLEGNYIKDAHGTTVESITAMHRDIQGGTISDLERAAIRLLVGD